MYKVSLPAITLGIALVALVVLLCLQDPTLKPSRIEKARLPSRPTAQEKTIADAVDAALKWLACALKECRIPGHDYEKGLYGLAALPLIEGGSSYDKGPHSESVKDALCLMTSIQASEGYVYESGDRWMYSQAIAVLALSMIRSQTEGEAFKHEAEDAARYLRYTLNPDIGWEYLEGSSRTDVSLNCMTVLALKEAQKAGVMELPDSVCQGALSWIDRLTDARGKVGYMRPGDNGYTIRGANDLYWKYPCNTASAVTCRLLCGQDENDERVRQGLELILENPPEWFKGERSRIDMYYAFWAAYAVSLFRPTEDISEWASQLASSILAIQETSGDDVGSFPPIGKWGMVGGRVYSTAMCALALQKLKSLCRDDLSVWERRGKRPGGPLSWPPQAPREPFEELAEEEDFELELEGWPKLPTPEKGEPRTLEQLAWLTYSRKINICFSNASIENISTFLRDITRVTVLLSPEVDEYIDSSVTVRDMLLADVLRALCFAYENLDYGLTMIGKTPAVVFSTPEDIAARAYGKSQDFLKKIDPSRVRAKLDGYSCPFGLTPHEVSQAEAVEEKLKQKPGIAEKAVTLSTFRRLIEDGAGVNVKLDDQADETLADKDPEVELKHGETYAQLFWNLQSTTGLWRLDSPDGVTLTGSSNFAALRCHAERCEYRKKLETKTVDLDFQDVNIDEVFRELNRLSGMNFVMSHNALDSADDTFVTLKCVKIRVMDALAEICRMTKLRCEDAGSFMLVKGNRER